MTTFLFLLLLPVTANASFEAKLYSENSSTKTRCPGTFGHSAQLVGEAVSTGARSYSAESTINVRLGYAQRRVDEAINCPNLTEKQSEKISKNYAKQNTVIEKKVEKVKNKEGVVEKVANQSLYQQQKLQQVNTRNDKIKATIEKMRASALLSAQRIVGKYVPQKKADFETAQKKVNNSPTKVEAPAAPPSGTQNTGNQNKTEAQIRAENDCYPDETIDECLYGSDDIPADGSGRGAWDGKYNSKEEYERANGLR